MKTLHGRGLPRRGEADTSALHAPEHKYPNSAIRFLRVIIKQENVFTTYKNFAFCKHLLPTQGCQSFQETFSAFFIVFIKCCYSVLVAHFRRASREIKVLFLTVQMV